MSIQDLVAELQRANWAYHNTDTPILSDDDYDRKLEELRRRSPAHPFLALVGAAPAAGKDTVLLPYVMGSQDKVREGEGSLARWLKRDSGAANVKTFIVSEKLDGLSCLLTVDNGKAHMYLRGDGVKGVCIDWAAPSFLKRVAGPIPGKLIVRGELVLANSKTPEGSIGRSLVNGWVHRKAADEMANVDFLTYQVLEPVGMSRMAQMAYLTKIGFSVPWWQPLALAQITEEKLTALLKERKAKSAYPLDGLVVGTNTVPVGVGGGEAKNPPDSVAYKASLDEQKAETTVVGVEWNCSRQGMLIPRIQIEPVQIGGATIQWLSGHNGKLIQDNGIGIGARIIVRRSGDVIPTLDTVLVKASTTAMPPAGTWAWEGVHVVQKSAGAESPVANPRELLHALQTLEVEGIGPGLVDKLAEGGFSTMRKLWDATPEALAVCIGAGRGPALAASLRTQVDKASMVTLLVASNKLPRGVGDRKLRALQDAEPDMRRWRAICFCSAPPGWTLSSLSGFWPAYEDAKTWIHDSFPGRAVQPTPAPSPTPTAVVANPQEIKGYVCFSGVRDKVLEGKCAANGWQIEDSLTKKTTVLVVPDGDVKESAKVKKARESGGRIQILPLTQFRAQN
jgi:DNA ligase (NAD+)